jgi:threonine-phosphate decarboxylase
MVDRDAIADLCGALPETVFVVDESYLPFAPHPEQVTLIGSDLPNLMVLNSMSKAFRIPGLRIGFVKAPANLLEKLNAFALPWSVNSLAQVAVQWLMTHPDAVEPFLAATRTMIEREKRRIEESIHLKCGARWFPSATSFLLMRLPRGLKAAAVWEQLAAHRILIRDCSNFTGLSDEFIRISMKNEEENRRAADLLNGLLRNQGIQRAGHGG